MSYRRADSAATAGRPFDRLSEHSGWLVASWGACRDAFERSRARSIAALILAILIATAGVALIAFLY